jgi:CheY-like chemotaxis protein
VALKILLADDSMTAQNMGKKILADAGHEVLAVSNGAAAIKKIASDRPDIIILDVYMPGYTGLEVCERVKAASETARIPVLLTVGKMEPFKPEEANRVRADGVMIKPFEATDLIAAIDGISKKMKSATASDVSSPVPSIAKQLRAEPVQKSQAEVTPQPNADHEETLRLTPEQVRALQDQSSKDWPPRSEAQQAPKPEDNAAFVVAPPVVVEQSVGANDPLEVSAVSILEPAKSDFATYEDQPATAYVPGLDDTEAPMTRAMAGHDFFTVTPPVPASSEPEESFGGNSPAAFLASEDTPVAASERVFKLQQFEESGSSPEPYSASSVEGVLPELETSAPVVPAPSFDSRLEEFDTNVTPQAEEVVEAAPELEINSPIHQQPEVNVVQDAALVTESDDLNQFTTRFGVEGAEQVHVGVAADLSEEQFAAISPAEADTATFTVQQLEVASRTVQPEETEPVLHQEVPVLEEPESFVPPIVPLEAAAAVLDNTYTLSPEPEPIPEEAPITGTHAGFLGEVGPIEAEISLNGTARMEAYVPSFEDTQPIPAFVNPVPEPQAAFSDQTATEPVPEVPAPEVEVAAAAAAGADASVAATHFFIASQPVPALEEPSVQGFAASLPEPEPAPTSDVSIEPAVAFTPEQPITDTALAEELARTLAEKEAAVLANTTALEPEPTASEEVTEPGSETMRLTDAVARAFDRLRPTLIAEILKEIKK